MRVLAPALLCVLTGSSVLIAAGYRTPHAFFGPTMLVGAALTLVTALLVARRIAVAAPSGVAHMLLDVFLRYAPLVVLNLIVLSVLAPVLGLVATLMHPVSIWKYWLTLLGLLSAYALFCLFALAIAGFMAVLAMRLADRGLRGLGVPARAQALGERALIAVTAAYCVWIAALACNGALDRGPRAEHASELIRVWRVPGTWLGWATLRAWDSPGGEVHVLLIPGTERDSLVPTLLAEGQQMRVVTRPGRLGIPWVEHVNVDFESDLEPLVAAAPTAGRPRRDLIARLLQEGRFADAAEHTAIYAKHHPAARAFVSEVEEALRSARRTQAAGGGRTPRTATARSAR
jgi:hypothetical protein